MSGEVTPADRRNARLYLVGLGVSLLIAHVGYREVYLASAAAAVVVLTAVLVARQKLFSV